MATSSSGSPPVAIPRTTISGACRSGHADLIVSGDRVCSLMARYCHWRTYEPQPRATGTTPNSAITASAQPVSPPRELEHQVAVKTGASPGAWINTCCAANRMRNARPVCRAALALDVHACLADQRRGECLNAHWFLSLADAKIEAWRRHYNESRPHTALGWLKPRVCSGGGPKSCRVKWS
jgi:hypothetical protein